MLTEMCWQIMMLAVSARYFMLLTYIFIYLCTYYLCTLCPALVDDDRPHVMKHQFVFPKRHSFSNAFA